MGSIISGIIIGILISFAILGFTLPFEIESKGFFAVLGCVVILGSVIWFLYSNVETSRQWATGYNASKTTIENSLQSDLLTGYERMALVQQAAEYNQELAERQYRASQWYGFDESRDILSLEPIDIG